MIKRKARLPKSRLWRMGVIIIVGIVAVASCTRLTRELIRTRETPRAMSAADFSLVAGEEEKYALADINAALGGLWRGPDRDRTFILFVHGMGDYPNKAFREKTLEKIRVEYNAETLMFHWPSWVDFRTIPRANALESGAYLGGVLGTLAEEAARQNSPLAGKKRVLVLHSLGAEVLRGFLATYAGGLPPDLLDAVVLTSPESALRGHAVWLGAIDFASEVYVFLNSKDRVLDQVRRHTGQSRLGMTLAHRDGRPEPLAPGVTYVLTDRATEWHRFYIERRSPNLAAVMSSAVNGARSPAAFGLLEPLFRPNVYAVVE